MMGGHFFFKNKTWPPTFLYIFSYDIEITDEIVGRAPVPELIVGVKQDGNQSFHNFFVLLTVSSLMTAGSLFN